MKQPKSVAFVSQANFAHGHQQVNNASSRTGELENAQNELLEQTDGERLDIGATGTTNKVDPTMETVGEVDRTKNSER
jgi:hypothetical protein